LRIEVTRASRSLSAIAELLVRQPFVKWFALSYRTVVCLSVLSCPVCPVCNVGVLWPNGWMDQDETWHVGRPRLRPHCVRWDPAPRKRWPSPQFSAHVNVAPHGWMDLDVTWYGGRPWHRPHCVRWGPSSPQRGVYSSLQLFGPCPLRPNGWIDQDATWYGDRSQLRSHCVRWGLSSPSPKGHSSPPPLFGPCLLWPNGHLSNFWALSEEFLCTNSDVTGHCPLLARCLPHPCCSSHRPAFFVAENIHLPTTAWLWLYAE